MKIHFDGEPSTFRQMRALFPTKDTRQVLWTRPIPIKFEIRRPLRIAVEQWRRRYAS